jgi:hypothetical protein
MSEYRSTDEAKPMLAQFEGLARKCRATRHFLQQPLEHGLSNVCFAQHSGHPVDITFSRRDSLSSPIPGTVRGSEGHA